MRQVVTINQADLAPIQFDQCRRIVLFYTFDLTFYGFIVPKTLIILRFYYYYNVILM